MVVFQTRNRPKRIRLISLLFGILCATPGFAQETLRLAVFTTDLSDMSPKRIVEALKAENSRAWDIFDQISHVDADILWLGEIPTPIDGMALPEIIAALRTIGYDAFFTTDVNSGVPSGHDLDQDGDIDGRDAFGFGAYPGQDGMLVATKGLPIDFASVRTFQRFLWADMPNNRLPPEHLPIGAEPIVRLSTTSHWDVPIETPGGRLHFLVSHHTPPVFDGPEDYNGRRNADETRFWHDYLDDAEYIYDDAGVYGGLAMETRFVLGGTFGIDPIDGEGIKDSIVELLAHPRIQDVQPASPIGTQASRQQAGINTQHQGNAALDTADWWDYGRRPPPGNLRVDYLLPSAILRVVNSGVYWPSVETTYDREAPSHKIVWVDIEGPGEL